MPPEAGDPGQRGDVARRDGERDGGRDGDPEPQQRDRQDDSREPRGQLSPRTHPWPLPAPGEVCQPQFPIAVARAASATRTPIRRPFFHRSISCPPVGGSSDLEMMKAAFRLVIPRKGDFTCSPSQGQEARAAAVTATIEPELPEEEREVILAAPPRPLRATASGLQQRYSRASRKASPTRNRSAADVVQPTCAAAVETIPPARPKSRSARSAASRSRSRSRGGLTQLAGYLNA